jgi:hypothetical protein
MREPEHTVGFPFYGVIVVFEALNSFLGLLGLVTLVFKVFTFVDCLTRRGELFPAAGKQTKAFWLIILGIASVWNFFSSSPIGIINLIGIVAALVYFLDVRPALRDLGGGGRGGSGPFGPRSGSNW